MDHEILIKAENITKLFPGTIALSNVAIEVKKGSVHAICGENGAGKSTLMNIIGGVIQPSSGTILFEGRQIKLRTPKDAQDFGISFVHQELNLCEDLTVAENIFIGRLPGKCTLIDQNRLFASADQILKNFAVQFSSKKIVSSLNVSEKQIVEIAKAISLKSKLLILDEPTSSLSENETQKLFEIIRDLRNEGISILYISHRLTEIFEICDEITILRDGKKVIDLKVADTNPDQIINYMVGRELTDMYPDKSNKTGKEIFRVENLSSKNIFSEINFSLFDGEILGFSGLVGAGRSEIMRSLCAIDQKTTGEIFLDNRKVNFENYRDCIKKGVVYLTEDRKLEGLFLDMSVKNNISVANMEDVSIGIFIDEKKETSLAHEYIKKLKVKVSSINSKVSSLSGGNQQKIVISKWLSVHPRIIIMDEPTRGIDVGAKSEIHKLLRSLANQGIGIIIISSELSEAMGLCDRIIVIHEGRIFGELASNDFSEEKIMRFASGQRSILSGEITK